MPSYTYTGLEESIVLRGITFPKGEAVEVSDAGFEAKLDAMPYFTSDKPKVEQAHVDPESEEVAGLKRKIAALEAENATLRKQLAEYVDAADEAEDIDSASAPVGVRIKNDPPPPGDVEFVNPKEPDVSEPIPDDWREWHWKRQMVLAKKFTDQEISNQADAVAAIELELEARGG